jgi:hypothetical protein
MAGALSAGTEKESLMHRGHSLFWWTGEYRQRIEYPRLSAFICG